MLLENDHSQSCQLNFILKYFGCKKNGIFVDCGILDGIRHSNTYDLEKDFGWTGLLIEASPSYMRKAKKNRSDKNVFINKALYHTTGKVLEFNEIDWSLSPGLSGLVESYDENHLERIDRETAGQLTMVKVQSITLNDALTSANIEPGFEFLKLDLEGGESNALKGLDIIYWKPQLVACEINYESNKHEIFKYFKQAHYKILSKKGGDYFFTRDSGIRYLRIRLFEVLLSWFSRIKCIFSKILG